MRTHKVKEEMGMIWEAYVMGEEDHRGHGHDCKKVHPDQSHDEWKADKETKKVEEGLDDEERDRLTNLGPVNDVPYKYKSKRSKGNKREAGIMDKMKGYQNPEQLRKQDQPREEGGSFADSNPLPGAPRYGHDEPDENYPPEDENFFEPDERQYDKAVQFIDWLMNPSNQAAKKYLEAFRDPNANAMDLGREIYGNMSPELQREYDQDVLIDAIEDKLAETGMRPKESNLQPFDQYFNEDGDGQQRVMDQFIAAINEVDADSSIMDIQDLAQELISVHKADPRELEQHMRRAKVSFEEDEIQYVLTGGDDIEQTSTGFDDGSPRERSRREMDRGQTPSRFGPTGDDARDYD